MDISSDWEVRLKAFLPGIFERSDVLRTAWERSDAVLHGSTTRGIDDACSDLDVWIISPADALARVEREAGTRFIGFTLDGKKGHCNFESEEQANRWISACDLEKIAELRCCRILFSNLRLADRLAESARCPMPESLRRSWFFHHYVEHCAALRNADNPMERGDSLAALQTVTPALSHALRAALVLDYQPYPYVKWLAKEAALHPTGARVLRYVEQCMRHISAGALNQSGPELNHPIRQTLRRIREELIGAARGAGINELWLDRWWRYIAPAHAVLGNQSW